MNDKSPTSDDVSREVVHGFVGPTVQTDNVTYIIEKMSVTAPGDVQKIAASQLELLTSHYNTVLAQAKQSFRWALIAAAIGLAFFVVAVGFLLRDLPTNIAIISTIAGGIVEIISGLNFFLYGRTTKQLAHYHNSLDQTQRFLLANSICESLDGDEKKKMRSELIRKIIDMNSNLPEQTMEEKTT